jgi:hypothetical protein
MEATIGPDVRLNGYDVAPISVEPGQTLQVSLYWQPLQRISEDLTSFVHVLTMDGERIAQSDKLLGGVHYPTSAWKPGEGLLDRHGIALPTDAPPGPYRLATGLYVLDGEEARTVGATELVGKVGGDAPADSRGVTPANPFYANLNDELLLVGYELDSQRLATAGGHAGQPSPPPEDELAVTLLWQAARPMADDYTVFVHLLDADGTIVAQRDVQPFQGTYPTSVWTQGELLADTYLLPLPDTLPSGEYEVVVGLYVARSGQRLPAYDELGQRFPNDRIRLAQVGLR